MSNSSRAKVLMVGPVHGQLRLLSDKLRTLQKSKAGPFDVCLCCGPFFFKQQAAAAPPAGNNGGGGDGNSGGEVEEKALLQQTALNDAKALLDGSLTFDVPVLFVDDGDGPPPGLAVKAVALSSKEELKKMDSAEIDLEDDDDEDDDAAKTNANINNVSEGKGEEEEENTVPDGLLRMAPNLYQLVGDTTDQRGLLLDSTADIISVPLPLIDPTTTTTTTTNTNNANNKRQHPTSLIIGFLGPKIRLPCKKFEEKAKHTSFLGCDVLISGEWGQGMSSSACGALTEEDRRLVNGIGGIDENGNSNDGGNDAAGGGALGDSIGSYDVAELIAMSRPRYHMAPGPIVPVQSSNDNTNTNTNAPWKLHHRFIASLPYRYPTITSSSTTSSGESHAGRFLSMGNVVSPSEFKGLGKAFKFIHAVGIVPLAYMDANDREAAMELGSVVDCPYTDASYDLDVGGVGSNGIGGVNRTAGVGTGGLSEAQARRLAQEDAASRLGGGGGGEGGAFRWQQRQTRKRPRGEDDENGGGGDDAAKQAMEEDNHENRSLFLHGLHRDPGMTLSMDILMDAFRPFGCVAVRFPKPRMNNNRMGHHNHHHQQHQQAPPPSFAFLDFKTHEEASQCLADLKGEAVVRNIMLTLKWSSSSSSNKRPPPPPHQPFMGGGIPPPPPPKRRNRLTEAEAVDSTTLFLRLPPTLDSASYPKELETICLLAQGTMEDELNIGVPEDSPDRITAADEPALRVTVRQPNEEMNYGFLSFASHAAALTTLVALTGQEDGGVVSEDKLATGVVLGSTSSGENGEGDDAESKKVSTTASRTNVSHLLGVTLFWAKGGQPKSSAGADGTNKNYGLKFNKQHFPPDSRTDCWFCLASPTCEKHLIVAVHDECYIAMPKGAVNEFHSLIVPVEHGGDGALVNRKLAPEMESVKSKLRFHARNVLQKDLFVFERCIQTKGGYHTHVQCIPVDTDSGPTIQSKMLEMAIRAGFQLKEITSDLGLNALEDDWSDGYFYAEIPLPGGGNEFRRFIYRAGDGKSDNNGGGGSRGHVPLQFGREVLAEVMGNPDIAQWKACVVSQEKEEELTGEFRKSLGNIER